MNEWRGIPREEIPWFPTIDAALCTGCRECINFCRNDVLAFDEASGRTVVAHPYHCVVECRTCARFCPAGAISFPDEAAITAIIKERLHSRHAT